MYVDEMKRGLGYGEIAWSGQSLGAPSLGAPGLSALRQKPRGFIVKKLLISILFFFSLLLDIDHLIL